ncbi:MAG: lactate utilization protein [Christensenellales bacterium]|jgi:hypothetical protein|nr:lactate utilization protein [Clostridia bacterium]HRU84223.1 lactate utilization protein [Eubacteriales bacterium]
MDIEKTLKNLNKRGFKAVYFKDGAAAADYILSLVPAGASAGFGGSRTLAELKIPSLLNENGRIVYHRGTTENMSAAEIMKNSMSADWFFLSANALTENGEIINTDGRANRVGASIYGPGNVVVVAGVNKIVKNLAAAMKRIKTVAAPLNAKRLEKSPPCVFGTPDCMNCGASDTICCVTAIHHRPTYGRNFVVIIVGETLGF